MNNIDFDKIHRQMDRRMNAMLNPDSEDAKALRAEEKKARKKMKRLAILGGLGGGCLYVLFVLLAIAINLGVLAAGVYIVVWVLQSMGVL